MRRLWLLALAAIMITGCGDTADVAKKPKTEPAETTTSTEPAESKSTEPAKAEPAPTPEEQFTALREEFDEMQGEFKSKIRTAAPSERRKLMQENPIPQFVPKFKEFAEKFADSEVAIEAWKMVAKHANDDSANVAIQKWIDNDPNSTELIQAISDKMGRMPNPNAEDLADTR